MTFWIIWTVLLLWTVYSCLQMYRLDRIHRYRQQLLEEIHELTLVDIQRGLDYDWRYRDFGEVSFRQMMRFPWRSLPSYYASHTFHTKDVQ